MRGASASRWRTRLMIISSALLTRSRRCMSSSQEFDRECLDETPGVADVFINAPGIRPVAPSRVSQFVDCAEEFRAVGRVDAVFHHREDRPPVVLDLPRDRGRAPVRRRGEIDPDAGLKFPAPCQRNAEKQRRLPPRNRRSAAPPWRRVSPRRRCRPSSRRR